jgi:hypothetical protein
LRLRAGRGLLGSQLFLQFRDAARSFVNLRLQLFRALAGFRQRTFFSHQTRLQRLQLLAALYRGFRRGLGLLLFFLFQLCDPRLHRTQRFLQLARFRRRLRQLGLRLPGQIGVGAFRAFQRGQLFLKLALSFRHLLLGLFRHGALPTEIGHFLGQALDFGLGAFGQFGGPGLFLRAPLPRGALLASLVQFRLQLVGCAPNGIPFLCLEFQFLFAFARAHHRPRVFIHLPANPFQFLAAGHQLPPNSHQFVRCLVAIGARLDQRLFQAGQPRPDLRRRRLSGGRGRRPRLRSGRRADCACRSQGHRPRQSDPPPVRDPQR